MGGVHVAVEKIISPLNHCRLAAICVSRFDGPMLMAFSGLSTDVFFPHMFWKFLRLMRGCHEMSSDISAIYFFLLGYLKFI